MTYPDLITMDGAKANRWNKWTNMVANWVTNFDVYADAKTNILLRLHT